jgi:purine-nucleoside/S-methyl-5'-thioadenosine phosphorylase / adenosine deaminase
MGRKRDSGSAGRQGRTSAEKGERQGALRAPFVSSELREVLLPDAIPRYDIPGWHERYGVVAGITGRGFDLGLWSTEPVGEVMSRWLAFRREMRDFQAVALGNQVHGVELMSLRDGRGWIQVEGIDGWITTTPGILLTVTIADCVPVYLLAPGRGIALLHAGWRGTAGGILGRGVERLMAETGCPASDVVMHCGVGICGTCYEVGSEVITGCGAHPKGDGPWHIDLRQRLADEAAALGLQTISRSPWCSAHDRSAFYSHRGSQGTDGRMVAYIGIGQRDRWAAGQHR